MADDRQSLPESKLSAPSPIDEMVAEVVRALHAVEPTAFLVLPRVLRRVVKQEWELPALTVRLPHRKSWIVARNQLIKHVDWDELGLEPNSELPEKAILIARPDDKHLESMSSGELKLLVWRLLYHARIHVAFDGLKDAGQLTASDFRQRVDQIGQVEFDEIRSVLKRENFLRPEASLSETYIEFAAVYAELKHFMPHCLATYFPSFADFEHVDAVLNVDVAIDELFERTRLAGSPVPQVASGHVATFAELDESQHDLRSSLLPDVSSELTSDGPSSELIQQVANALKPVGRPNLRTYSKLTRRADKAFEGGNAVGAALLQMRAARFASAELVPEAVKGALTDIWRLVKRLQVALAFDNQAARSWFESMVGLLLHAMQGFWNADKKLLYDLQKVCVDHEREIYTVDLLGWAMSLGARPVKRALPNQREVLMSKHLRSATRRLVAAKLTGDERQRLSDLLHEADESAERQMRTRLRPLTTQALTEIGFAPKDVPERVGFNKLVEELLDGVVVRGFVTMGDLRDAISRCSLKLRDLAGPVEFMSGDLLLKADARLTRALDGVYQRGDIHLRWLQRLSAASFGTVTGRFLTRYAAIPYGVAFLAYSAVAHLIEKIVAVDPPEAENENVLQPLESLENAADEADLREPPAEPKSLELVAHDAESVGRSEPATATKLLELRVHETETVAVVVEQSPVMEWLHDPRNTWSTVGALGTFLLLVIHLPGFRKFLGKLLKKVWRFVWRLCFEWPARVLRLPAVKKFLKSVPAVIARKLLVAPLIATAFLCGFLPWLNEWPKQPAQNWAVVWAAMAVVLNSRVGRDVEEVTTEWLHHTWNRIRAHIFVALFDLVMESFKKMLEWFERVLYAVDEWLRFKSGETSVSLAVKAVLSIFWAAITFVLRFCVNLLIEPQINPIKHFPVVTVSHKLLLPLAFTSTGSKPSPLGGMILLIFKSMPVETANTIAATVVFGIPGIFGFLVWELKSNWRLYAANRSETLQPVLVGSHGETIIRLMKPGFHSGTLPKLFARLRHVDRHRSGIEHSPLRSKYLDQLHHVQIAVKHFIERELLALLELCGRWERHDVQICSLRLASNNMQIEIACASLGREPMLLLFEEQSGWLIASTARAGWVRALSDDERRTLQAALVGLFRLAGVDLVREQVAATFSAKALPYDVAETGLVVWPDGMFVQEVTYPLHQQPWVRPYPKHAANAFALPTVNAENLLFTLSQLEWSVWAEQWDARVAMKRPVLPEHIGWHWPAADA